MITKIETLLNTQQMTVKETNVLARELHDVYFDMFKEIKQKLSNAEKYSNNYFIYAHQIGALMGLITVLNTLGYTKRRSQKMILDLEREINEVEDNNIPLI